MWTKQPVPGADRGAGPPAHRHILPSAPGDVYPLVRVYRMSGLTSSRVLTFPLKAVSPSSCGAGLHLLWAGGPILPQKQEKGTACEMCSSDPQSPDLAEGEAWARAEVGSKSVVSPGCSQDGTPPGQAGRGGEFLHSLGSRACSPNTAGSHGA